jgi:hypothetical protein
LLNGWYSVISTHAHARCTIRMCGRTGMLAVSSTTSGIGRVSYQWSRASLTCQFWGQKRVNSPQTMDHAGRDERVAVGVAVAGNQHKLSLLFT